MYPFDTLPHLLNTEGDAAVPAVGSEEGASEGAEAVDPHQDQPSVDDAFQSMQGAMSLLSHELADTYGPPPDHLQNVPLVQAPVAAHGQLQTGNTGGAEMLAAVHSLVQLHAPLPVHAQPLPHGELDGSSA